MSIVEVAIRAVAMDARARLLCYPRGSFYPLSSNHSMLDWRIIKTNFRSSFTCRCHCQAGINLCAFPTISIRGKPTFVPLRYTLAGYRPSKTAQQAAFPSKSSLELGKDLLHFKERCYTFARRLPPTLDN